MSIENRDTIGTCSIKHFTALINDLPCGARLR